MTLNQLLTHIYKFLTLAIILVFVYFFYLGIKYIYLSMKSNTSGVFGFMANTTKVEEPVKKPSGRAPTKLEEYTYYWLGVRFEGVDYNKRAGSFF